MAWLIVFVHRWVIGFCSRGVYSNFAFNKDNNPADYNGFFDNFGNLAHVYFVVGCCLYWIIDYRFYDKDNDDKTKLHHVKEMFLDCIQGKKLPFTIVLMDSWYAVKWLMLLIESEHKIYYCPIKGNRNINEISNIEVKYQRVDSLTWTDEQKQQGRRVHLRQFPKGHSLQIVYRSLPSVQIILSRMPHKPIS